MNLVRQGWMCAMLWTMTTVCQAQYFAAEVIDYVPGTLHPVFGLTNPAAALGKPGAIIPGSPEFVSEEYSFPMTPAEPLNPFTPHYDGSELVQVGPGGHLTLRLERYVTVGSGLELGVFGNVGLINMGTTPRTAGSDAFALSFGIDDVVIEVSETGAPGSWVAINGGSRVTIQNPSSYYTDATGLVGPTEHASDLVPLLGSLTESDFGQPFAGGIAQFNDLTIGQIEATLAGSAGGDWFDLSGLMVGGEPLTRVGFVRFSDPAAAFELMAVSINTSLAGGVVPEPATIGLVLLGVVAVGVRQQFRKRG